MTREQLKSDVGVLVRRIMELVHEYNKDKDIAEGAGAVFSITVTNKETGGMEGGAEVEGFTLNATAAVYTIFNEHKWLPDALEHLVNNSKVEYKDNATKDTNTKLN